MPLEIVMPKLGLTMTEGLIVEWKLKPGDTVKKGDVLFLLETEKVTYEVEAPEDGVLAHIMVPAGETVPVGTVVGLLARPGEDVAPLEAIPAESVPAPKAASAAEPERLLTAPAPDKGGRIKASPLARKMAAALNVALAEVHGTGPGGRILRADVDAARTAFGTTHLPPTGPSTEASPGAAAERTVPFTGMRRAIAKKMLAAKVETAQTYMSINIDASQIVAHRQALLPQIEAEYGVRVTITDIIMKVTASAIGRHPVINTRWSDNGVVFCSMVHMGMAMALDEGLIVPVIRDIQKKTFGQVAVARTELIAKGRENRFLPDDISGSTFTVSAMGMFGIEQFTSNINLPEGAILAVGAIVDKPVAAAGQVVIKPMMNVTLSYDHRMIDGAEAGKFLRTLRLYLENPILILA